MRVFRNRKASRNYFFIQELEAGIVLEGTEIKSIRAGKLSFKDSYGKIENGEIWLCNLHISSYEHSGAFGHEPERKRKLLLNKREIRKLTQKVEEKGFTLIPKEIYINEKGLVKVKLAIARGKRLYDKRETIRKKDELKDLERKLKIT
ncbi:MAG: SsrA-binding protein SmpB [Candidatus Cloacimonetes bacterium]|nr:SsrA-binding protein SmpB [Candidatus Cloacimonadota bacterium]